MFRKNSTICFLGDSITSNGKWIYEIYDRFKADNLKIFNCGRSGMTALEAIRRISETCFVYSPDYIVVMFGMNDINRRAYADSFASPDKEEIKAAALADYSKNIRRLYDICENFGAEIILCSPTAYDESQSFDEENMRCNSGLEKCTEIVKSLAAEKGCKFIDFHTPMSKLIGNDIYTNPDRVHPNSHGEHIMAQLFLKEVGKIDTMDFEGKYEFGKELQELFDISCILRGMAFTELHSDISNALDKRLDICSRKEIIRKKYESEKDKTMYVPRMYKIYIDSIDYKADYEKLYIDKMIAFLNS